MEKRKWLWKKRSSSDKSPGDTESSGSISTQSERFSDEQDTVKDSPDSNVQSPEVTSKESPDINLQLPEVTSKAAVFDDEVKENMRSLAEKLSAALVNVSAKEELVKQHAKVAEEAVAGWEKAENEVVALKQQLEAAVQQNLNLDVRVSHLDGALKECVRQLRQAREEQEQRIQDAVTEKTSALEATKNKLESQLLELQHEAETAKAECPAFVDPSVLLRLEFLEKENAALKLELLSRSEELEIRTMERDLSTQAAETASKQQLESIKKVAKLEAECRRLQASARKSHLAHDQKSVAPSSVYVESLADSQSDSGERLSAAELDTRKMSKLDPYDSEPNCTDSWASALIAELHQFKNEKTAPRALAASSVEIDMMDDFLEMERLASLPEMKSNEPSLQSEVVASESTNLDNPLKEELDTLNHRVNELEEKLEKIEAEKIALEIALNESQDALRAKQANLSDAEMRLDELQKDLATINESKELLEFQLIGMEVETRTLSANVSSLKAEVDKERALATEKAVRCQELENELTKKCQELERQQTMKENNERKIKQEDLVVAADKLAECQKTIASLGLQLKSLATLEDFLVDTANLPGFSGGGSLIPTAGGESWKLHPNEAFVPKCDTDPTKVSGENLNPANNEESPASSSSSSSSSANHVGSIKSRNGFGKLFSRSKTAIQLEHHLG